MNEDLPDEVLQRIADERLDKVLPKPNSGEKRDKFLQRCMGNSSMNSEFPDAKQRFAVCQRQADRRGK